VSASADELGKVVVGDNHAAEVERLEALERCCELSDPRPSVGAPVLGDEPVHGRAGLPLDRERLEPREPRQQASRGHRVAEGHCDVLPRERIDAVPQVAHQRRRLPVAGVVHVPHHQVQRLLGDPAAAEAHRAAQPLRLRRLPAHRSDQAAASIRLGLACLYACGSAPSLRGSSPPRAGDMGIPPLLPLFLDLVVVRGAGLLEQAEESRANYWREKSGVEDDDRGGDWGRGGRLLLRDPAGDTEPRLLGAGRAICSARAHTRPVSVWRPVLMCLPVWQWKPSSGLVMNRMVDFRWGRDTIAAVLACECWLSNIIIISLYFRIC
jgi:hypothetical protein